MSVAASSVADDLAFPFLPADPQRHGVAVHAGAVSPFDVRPLLNGETEVVVWVRLPDRSPLARAAFRVVAYRSALRALNGRLPPGWRVAGVHALPPRSLRPPGLRTALASAARAGVVVEFAALPEGGRVLDAVAAAAGVASWHGDLHLGAGGALVARATLAGGTGAVMRLARAGSLADPARAASTLEQLASAGVTATPRLLGRGGVAGASWTAETLLPGRRPRRLTTCLASQVAEVCATFPTTSGAPLALGDDLAGISARLPDRAPALEALANSAASRLDAVPAVLRHGDLWAGNVLVDGGRLTGVTDWDAAHPSAVPGADLVHLVAVGVSARHNRGLGASFLERPWRSRWFRRVSAPYWSAIGLAPQAHVLDTAGIAWWAAAVHGTLMRIPARTVDSVWLAANVDAPLRALTSRRG